MEYAGNIWCAVRIIYSLGLIINLNKAIHRGQIKS